MLLWNGKSPYTTIPMVNYDNMVDISQKEIIITRKESSYVQEIRLKQRLLIWSKLLK